MPTLNQYKVNDSNGQMYFSLVENPVVEPLDGPFFVEHLMLRFPEEVYSKSRDSHLYRFLTALVGESGAGILKKKSLIARLQFESVALGFQNLDNLYSPLIGFDRLPNEKYLIDPRKSTLTSEEWQAIEAADKAYRSRAAGYLQAARLGGTLKGVEAAASAAIGKSVSVTENYKYIFNRASDYPTDIKKYGTTNSVNEFVIRPEVNQNPSVTEPFARLAINSTNDSGYFNFVLNNEYSPNIYVPQVSSSTILSALLAFENLDSNNILVEQTTTTTYIIKFRSTDFEIGQLSIDVSNLDNFENVGLQQSSLSDLFYVGNFGDPSSEYYDAVISNSPTTGLSERTIFSDYLNPYVQKNLDNLVSKIQPQGTIFSISPSHQRYVPVKVNNVFASSEKFSVSRFVTGNASTNYGQSDPLNGKILEAGQENEERNYPYVGIDMPIVFLTVDTVIAYSDTATNDPAYDSDAFYNGSNPAYQKYPSTHAGKFFDPIQKIYPFLQNVDDNAIFYPSNILPVNDTNAIFKGALTV